MDVYPQVSNENQQKCFQEKYTLDSSKNSPILSSSGGKVSKNTR